MRGSSELGIGRIVYRMNEKFRARPTDGDSTGENCSMNIGFLKHGVSVTT
jgi:hypothetical protein